jgi:predicted RNA-binding Zn-ribbon protein involved in translation (DUF1610 family)
MTLNTSCKHQCPPCSTEYIAFETDVPCPRCGLVQLERCDFIRVAARLVLFNLEDNGSYVPPVWMERSFGDSMLCKVF